MIIIGAMDTLGARIAHYRKLAKLSQAALAEACGWKSQSRVGNYEADTREPTIADIEKMAKAMRVRPEQLTHDALEGEYTRLDEPLELPAFLRRGDGERGNVIAHHPEDPIPESSVNVPEYRVNFSAGDGHEITYEVVEESEPAIYRLSWFRKHGIKPANAKRFRVTGDSMETYLYAGDSILVNLAENDPANIIDGAVYAIRYVDKLRVKRLYRQLEGTLTLRSDNSAYPDENVPPEVAEEHITIIGRVRDRSGSGGL